MKGRYVMRELDRKELMKVQGGWEAWAFGAMTVAGGAAVSALTGGFAAPFAASLIFMAAGNINAKTFGW